ncbi:hypothetical protein IWZ01DRAFT_559517 [Phyllosticta capitalensis]
MDETLPGVLNGMLQEAKPLLPAHEDGFDEDVSDRGDPSRRDRGEPPKRIRYMGGYSNSGKFSDLTLVDDSGNQHLVHRHVLCAASPFFIQSLPQDSGDPARQTIKIKNTDPAIVYCSLDFIYNMVYDEPDRLCKDHRRRILFNTQVYAFARKHDIGGLDKYAVDKIFVDLPHEVDTFPEHLPGTVLKMCKTVPDEAVYKGDSTLHKLLVVGCATRVEYFLGDGAAALAIQTLYPQLFRDILQELTTFERGRCLLRDKRNENEHIQRLHSECVQMVKLFAEDKRYRDRDPTGFDKVISNYADNKCYCPFCRYFHWGDNWKNPDNKQ